MTVPVTAKQKQVLEKKIIESGMYHCGMGTVMELVMLAPVKSSTRVTEIDTRHLRTLCLILAAWEFMVLQESRDFADVT